MYCAPNLDPIMCYASYPDPKMGYAKKVMDPNLLVRKTILHTTVDY